MKKVTIKVILPGTPKKRVSISITPDALDYAIFLELAQEGHLVDLDKDKGFYVLVKPGVVLKNGDLLEVLAVEKGVNAMIATVFVI